MEQATPFPGVAVGAPAADGAPAGREREAAAQVAAGQRVA
jgi:hypothetical protein